MRAMTIPRFGDADVLRLAELPDPEPGPGEIAIDVAFAGVNYAEILFRSGFVDVPLPFVPGIEVAGRVRAIGDGVEGWRVGQPAAALTVVDGGGYAEVAVTHAGLAAPLPDDAGATELAAAAAAPSNSTTAILVFEEVARLRGGESVLVHAAAGGVGSQLGQAARLFGASRVVGTVGTAAKVEAAGRFGYDAVVVRDELPARAAELSGGAGFDVVVDPVGGATRRASFGLLGPGGRLIVMGNASGADDVPFGATEVWLSGAALMGFNLALLSATRPDRVGRALGRALEAIRDGGMHVEVGEPLPLAAAADAHRSIESRASVGKLVLDVAAL
jgi:NADPH2:quinone reductase